MKEYLLVCLGAAIGAAVMSLFSVGSYDKGYRDGKAAQNRSCAKPLMPMGALTYAIACSHCRNQGGSPLCDDCICEIKSGFQLDPETMGRDEK